ncbi:MAG: mechanosensitive ion channel [Bradymonadaceae bacterium]|nr:mechanosensitive ion channel [Lujinxingiaceae bacterium]
MRRPVGLVAMLCMLVWMASPTRVHAQEGIAGADPGVLSEGHRPFEPGAMTDEAIGETLLAGFSQITTLIEVEVTVGAGVVTLSGTAPRPRARARAEAIAWRLPGVLAVENLIEVPALVDAVGVAQDERTARDEAIQQQLRNIFGHVASLGDLGVVVEAGVVNLVGTVPDTEASRRAEELAAALDGVLYVDNQTMVVRGFGERLRPTLGRAVEFLEDSVLYLPLFLAALVVLAVFFLLAKLLMRLDFLYRRLAQKPLVQAIVRQLVGTLVMLIGLVLILEIFDITALVGAVLGTAGLAGLALGFAFRDIAENYLASLMLSMRRPFHHNDWIRIGEDDGKVVRLTTRETVLMTLDGNHVRIPNAIVFKSIIHNYTRNPRRRFEIEVGVGLGEDVLRAQTVGIDALRAMAEVMNEPPPFAWVEDLADSDVKVVFYGWVEQRAHDFLDVRAEAKRCLKLALDRAGVEMPEPTYRVKLRPAGEPKAIGIPDTSNPVSERGAPRRVDELDEQIEEARRSDEEDDLLE